MFPAILLSLAIIAFGQFAVFYWRVVVAGVAAHPISVNLIVAAGLQGSPVSAADFRTLSGLNQLMPALSRQANGLSYMKLYFRLVDSLRHTMGAFIPSVASWSQREMATCASYAAVVIDRKMKSNLACAVLMRSAA